MLKRDCNDTKQVRVTNVQNYIELLMHKFRLAASAFNYNWKTKQRPRGVYTP